MKRRSTLAILLLCGLSATALAQDTVWSRLRFSFAAGPSLATTNSRQVRTGNAKLCFGCQQLDQVVSGATTGKYHVTLNFAGDVGDGGVTLRGEGVFNRNETLNQAYPPLQCARNRCAQRRKASRDDMYMVGGGLEFTTTRQLIVQPYVIVTAGLAVNKLFWNSDTASTALDGHSIGFGPFVSGGLGLRAKVRGFYVFTEFRRFQTFATPGSSPSPVSIGIQRWLRFEDHGV